MDRKMYNRYISRIKHHKELKHSKIPWEILDYGYSIAKFKAEHWIIERIHFWMYAYDRTHKWCKQDFHYEINDKAYEKAKEKRGERAKNKQKRAIKWHNKPRPFIDNSSWDGVSGAEEALKKQGLLDKLNKVRGKL